MDPIGLLWKSTKGYKGVCIDKSSEDKYEFSTDKTIECYRFCERYSTIHRDNWSCSLCKSHSQIPVKSKESSSFNRFELDRVIKALYENQTPLTGLVIRIKSMGNALKAANSLIGVERKNKYCTMFEIFNITFLRSDIGIEFVIIEIDAESG